ncbi:MAG: hypothetical protein NVS2B15_20490 [Pseudarthrobacter sp.]
MAFDHLVFLAPLVKRAKIQQDMAGQICISKPESCLRQFQVPVPHGQHLALGRVGSEV